jgi:hypothetical protein
MSRNSADAEQLQHKAQKGANEDQALEAPKAKRGPGRPPKNGTPKAPYVPTGKPRGRPKMPDHLKKATKAKVAKTKKAAPKTTSSTATTAATTTDTTTPKKGRGRPKKTA